MVVARKSYCFVLLLTGFFFALPGHCQTYSKSFSLQGKENGVFRICAYLRETKGAKKNIVKMTGSKKTSSESKPTPEKSK